MNKQTLRRLTCALFALAALPFSAAAARAQREHLTPEEIELVRDNQALDARIGVFVKAVERRLQALDGAPPAAKRPDKEAEKWGTLGGTRAQLLSDVAGILDEAITNVEDASIHSEKSPLIPKAVRALAAPAPSMLARLKALAEATRDESERASIERAAESLEQILGAAAKLPAEETKEQAKARERERKKQEQQKQKQQDR